MFGTGRLFFGLLVLAGLSLLFLIVGFFSPAWMIMKIDFDSSKMSDIDVDRSTSFSGLSGTVIEDVDKGEYIKSTSYFGLWFIRSCLNMNGVSACRYASFDDIQDKLNMESYLGGTSPLSNAMQAGTQNFLEKWKTPQVLSVFALLGAGAGALTLVVCGKKEDISLRRGLCMAGIWLVSGVFMFGAVGKRASDNAEIRSGFEMLPVILPGSPLVLEQLTPWAAVLAGIGASLELIIAAIILGVLLLRDRREAPGTWVQFKN